MAEKLATPLISSKSCCTDTIVELLFNLMFWNRKARFTDFDEFLQQQYHQESPEEVTVVVDAASNPASLTVPLTIKKIVRMTKLLLLMYWTTKRMKLLR
jgi:hypothetical protein